MNGRYSSRVGRLRREETSRPGGGGTRFVGLTPAQVFQLFNTPELRLHDHPGLLRLGELLMVTPEDQELQELFALSVERQAAQAMVANDPFYGNRPPAGTLPPLVPGRVPLVALPNGEVLSLEVGRLTRNLALVGPTGSGKTNFLFLLLGAILGQATVLAFDRKNELADIATAPGFEERVTVLRWEELRLAMLQPPGGGK